MSDFIICPIAIA